MTEQRDDGYYVCFSANGATWHCTAVIQNGHVNTACNRERPLNDCTFSDVEPSGKLCRTCRKITTREGGRQ
jgi:hypothetical protein